YGSDPRTCPVRAYRAWIAAANITEGPVFRHFHNRTMGTEAITDRVVALTVKKAAERVGIDADVLADHSLRSGHATTAARNGATEASIMRQAQLRVHGKGGKPRCLPLAPEILQLLDHYLLLERPSHCGAPLFVNLKGPSRGARISAPGL